MVQHTLVHEFCAPLHDVVAWSTFQLESRSAVRTADWNKSGLQEEQTYEKRNRPHDPLDTQIRLVGYRRSDCVHMYWLVFVDDSACYVDYRCVFNGVKPCTDVLGSNHLAKAAQTVWDQPWNHRDRNIREGNCSTIRCNCTYCSITVLHLISRLSRYIHLHLPRFCGGCLF